jgi:hypothetical protein
MASFSAMRLLTGGLWMFRLGAFDIRIELRRLAPIESPVVAHDANLAVPEFFDAGNFLR